MPTVNQAVFFVEIGLNGYKTIPYFTEIKINKFTSVTKCTQNEIFWIKIDSALNRGPIVSFSSHFSL
jgi:hypothetical protein